MTGEDIPDTGESGRARFYEIQVKTGDVPTGKALSTLQRQGANGYMAAAMAGYLEWLIPQADQLPLYLEGLFYTYRETMQEITPGAHGRLHEAGACLLVGWTMATAYWMEIEAITPTQAAEEAEAAQEAIAANIREQQRAMIADEPVGMFLRAVDELTASGKLSLIHIYKPRFQKFRKFRVFYTYTLYIYFNIIQMVRQKIRGGYIYFLWNFWNF